MRPADQDVAVAALNTIAAYFSALRLEADGLGGIETLPAAADAMLDQVTAAGEVLAVAPDLRGELRAMLILAHMDAEIARPILSRTTAAGTLLRRKLEPVTAPLREQMAVLRGGK